MKSGASPRVPKQCFEPQEVFAFTTPDPMSSLRSDELFHTMEVVQGDEVVGDLDSVLDIGNL